ncbi:MAG: shikimate dehydrogenase [Desulfobacterales bacterium]
MKTVKSIGTETRTCAVIGNPVAHSLSPLMHNTAYQKLGLDFVYLAFRVEDVKSALTGMRALENFRGMSVTIPHKIEAMKYVDQIAKSDLAIGSINTVINEKGKLFGMGTDGPGALKALVDAGVQIDGRNILILGAGGAARAIAFTLAQKSRLNQLAVLDIDGIMLSGLIHDLKAGTDARIMSGLLDHESLAENMKVADIIIQCTPVGMHPNEDASLIPLEFFQPEQVVFDIVYTPFKTKLLNEAGSLGLKVVSGVDMFINQAVLQFEHFTGVEAPIELMRQIVMEHLNS